MGGGFQDEERVWKTGRERHLQGCGCTTKAGGRKAAAKLDTNLSGGTMAEICGWVDGHLVMLETYVQQKSGSRQMIHL